MYCSTPLQAFVQDFRIGASSLLGKAPCGKPSRLAAQSQIWPVQSACQVRPAPRQTRFDKVICLSFPRVSRDSRTPCAKPWPLGYRSSPAIAPQGLGRSSRTGGMACWFLRIMSPLWQRQWLVLWQTADCETHSAGRLETSPNATGLRPLPHFGRRFWMKPWRNPARDFTLTDPYFCKRSSSFAH